MLDTSFPFSNVIEFDFVIEVSKNDEGSFFAPFQGVAFPKLGELGSNAFH